VIQKLVVRVPKPAGSNGPPAPQGAEPAGEGVERAAPTESEDTLRVELPAATVVVHRG
jgi:hypothetical protein